MVEDCICFWLKQDTKHAGQKKKNPKPERLELVMYLHIIQFISGHFTVNFSLKCKEMKHPIWGYTSHFKGP